MPLARASHVQEHTFLLQIDKNGCYAMIGKACARACFNYSATNHLHHYHLLKRWPREDNGLRKSRIICRSSSSSSIGINLHCTANTMPCSRHHQCTRVLCLTCLLVNDICVCAVDKVCAPCSCVDGSTKDITTLGRSSSTLLTAGSWQLQSQSSGLKHCIKRRLASHWWRSSSWWYYYYYCFYYYKCREGFGW